MSDQSFALEGGSSLAVSESVVMLSDGERLTHVDCSQITGVSRGGAELIVTRREEDPLRLRAATITDARAIEQAVATCCGVSPLYRRRWNPNSD